MELKVKSLIEKYDTIVIHRHKRPDLDAIGSQMGLFYLIKENYPNKNIYVVGDKNKFLYKTIMDDINDEVYKNALAIVIDVAVEALISDDRYKLASEVLIIDHHQNDADINHSLFYHLKDYTSACEILSNLANKLNWKVSSNAATYIYGGMVTDTGRFQFINSDNASRVFLNASFITKFNPDIKDLYNFLYTDELEVKLTRQMFSSFELTTNKVAYRKNDRELIEKSGLDIFSVSRGMVSQMAGIKEVLIWANFTEDYENNKILAEIRSRDIVVVDIAKKYGGGGHNFACGASLKDFNEADMMLKDLDERAKENEKNIKQN